MSEQYDPLQDEEKILKQWDKEKIYRFDPTRGKIFSIDTPPPYISGKMHMGHAFSYAQQDFIARYRRMKDNVFYPFGTDDNGLPTERYVEKLKNIKSKDMSRSEFIALCLKVLKDMTPGFIQDYKDLGISCDFEVYYSTIDAHSQKVSQKHFIDLYTKGFVYKKEFPVIWDSALQSPIAQAELEDSEQESLFSTLRFNVEGKDLCIATTRPELLPACVAVFVNPKDNRHKKLIGKKATVPLFNFEVPILADEGADPEKGTGVMMVCSYGDKYDVEAVNRHKLEPKIIINKDGTLNYAQYAGMPVKEARKKVLDDLDREGFIIEQKKISHVVNVSERTGQEIEFLPAEQWFITLLDVKKKLIAQGRNVTWYPQHMYKRYKNWVEGLEWDWSVSRERHFGVPIPVWECVECKEVILPEDHELPVNPPDVAKMCPTCGKKAKPEQNVLDTWATSSLTPQITAGLVSGVDIPFSLRPQAHDIIRTWAFYTIVRSLYHEKDIPWQDIMVSGYVTLGGAKMSKSKGTGVQPHELLKKYGADALRFWAAGSKLGDDMAYQEKDLVTGKKLVTKLINASKFVFMNLEEYEGKKPRTLVKTDQVFLHRLNELVKTCTDAFESYEYSKAKVAVDQFFWKTFCDNYLEIVKKRVYEGDENGRLSAQYALYRGLYTLIQLLAPFVPFVTEQVYRQHFKKQIDESSIHLTRWPSAGKPGKTEVWDVLIEVLGRVRQEKTKAGKSMKAEIVLTVEKDVLKQLTGMLEDLKNVTHAREVKEGVFGVKFVEKE